MSGPRKPRKGLTRPKSIGKRKVPIKARALFIDRGKPIPKKNAKAAKRKLARYQAFIQSPEWKAIRIECLERAGMQCEYVERFGSGRCQMTTQLTAHHVRYTRFGGQELPSDLQCLSAAHHALVESLKPGTRLWQRASA